MIGVLQRAVDRFRGSGSATITLPPMDGAILPNQAIEDARVVIEVERPDNLAFDGQRILFSSQNRVLMLEPDAGAETAGEIASLDSEVTALAADARGNVVVGLDDGTIVFVDGPRKGAKLAETGIRPSCPTALLLEESALFICHGSRQNRPSAWKHDLMQRNRSGSVWKMDLDSGATARLGAGLAFPYGLARNRNGDLAVSESWRHRIIVIASGRGGAGHALLDDLPGYPARLIPAFGAGYWLCVFAPRSRLVEFVLRERDFCADMFREIEPDYWVAPSLASGRSFLEPLQGGAIKQLGILKPWAPSRSYGLVIRLDADFRPLYSFHSRADGTRHGITSCLDHKGRILVASKGGNVIVDMEVAPHREDSEI